MQRYEAAIINWAQARDDIRAVLVVGSRARTDPPPDPHSDLDLMIYSADWGEYLQGMEWLQHFGMLWVVVTDDIGEGRPEFLAVYEGGDKLDFAFDRASKLHAIATMESLPEVLDRGYRVLVDKDGITAHFPPLPDSPPSIPPPTPDEFRRVVDTFWYGALYVARQIRRGNLWTVKYRDWTLKQQLLPMLEWHARGLNGWDYDTWYEGKHITRWADAATLAELDRCFGHFDAADSERALRATMDLFRRIATATAQRLGYGYPAALDENITRTIEGLFI